MNIAELGVKIDSADAVQAKTNLDEMAKAGGRAEQSATALMAEMQALEKSLSSGAKSTQELAKQRDALAKLTKTGAYGEAEAAKIGAQLDKQQIALAKSAMDEQKALTSLLGAIDPARAALTKLDSQVEQLGKHLDAGRISQDQYNSALSKIDKDYSKLEKTAGAFDKLRLGSRQAQENVMQLGNAFSTGDWGSGVRAITQLGAGAGASAASMAAILGPIALATAAIGGLAVAYYKGSEEADAYNKSLILTGNYAGVSAGQLGDMARQVSATVGTTGQAAEVLALLAGNGKIAGDSFVGITEAAVSMQEATGKAVSETVAEFAKLADDPVKASAALNEQYHYLTGSVYAQIVALEEQGDHAAAVKLATEQYSDAINERTPRILENLSLWEKGYNAVASAADFLKNIGRRDINSEIETARNDLKEAEEMDGFFQNPKSKDALIEFNRKRLEGLEAEKKAQDDLAKSDGERARLNGLSVRAQEALNAQIKSTASNAEKLNARLLEIDRMGAEAAGGEDGKTYSVAQLDKLRAAAREQFSDKKTGGSQVNLSAFNDQKNALAAISGEYKNAQKELDAAQRAGLVSQADYLLKRQAMLGNERDEVTAAYEAEISALEAAKAKKSTTAAQSLQLDQKIADARAGMLKAQKDVDSQLEVLATNEAGRLAKQERAISSYVQALGHQQRALELAGQRAALGVGRGDRQNALNGQLNSQQDRYAQQALELENQRSDPSRGMSEEEFKRKSQALVDANKAATDQIRQNYADVQAAQGDWMNGATAAWENYLDSARDVAGQTKSLFGNAFGSMEDAIVNFAMTGKLSFADFTKSILADMARIATRQASSALLSSLVGAATSYFGSSSAGAGTGATQGDYTGEAFSNWSAMQADGGAWNNGTQFFAKGGVLTNSIVSEPTSFGMAGNKRGIVGEAGPEAIMPLTRTSSGKLGVVALGGGGGATQINVDIHIDGDGNASSSSDSSGLEQFGQELAAFVEQKYQQLRNKDMGQGGVINRAIKGR